MMSSNSECDGESGETVSEIEGMLWVCVLDDGICGGRLG